MKLALFFSLFIACQVHAKEKSKTTQLVFGGPAITAEADAVGNTVFYRWDGPVRKPVDAAFISNVSTSILQEAKKMVCGMPIKPETIEVSLGVFSFSWKTSDICK